MGAVEIYIDYDDVEYEHELEDHAKSELLGGVICSEADIASNLLEVVGEALEVHGLTIEYAEIPDQSNPTYILRVVKTTPETIERAALVAAHKEEEKERWLAEWEKEQLAGKKEPDA